MTVKEHHKMNVNIRPEKLRKLLRGHRVQLNAEDLHGGRIPIALVRRQAKKLMTAMHRGKGIRLQLEPSEQHHTHRLHGGSFAGGASGATKFFRKVGRVAKSIASSALNAGGQQFLSGLATTALTDAGVPAPIAAAVGQSSVIGARHIAGVGQRRRRVARRGMGIKRDLINVVHRTAPKIRRAIGHVINSGLNAGGQRLLEEKLMRSLEAHGLDSQVARSVADTAVGQARGVSGLGHRRVHRRRRVPRGGSFLLN